MQDSTKIKAGMKSNFKKMKQNIIQ